MIFEILKAYIIREVLIMDRLNKYSVIFNWHVIDLEFCFVNFRKPGLKTLLQGLDQSFGFVYRNFDSYSAISYLRQSVYLEFHVLRL